MQLKGPLVSVFAFPRVTKFPPVILTVGAFIVVFPELFIFELPLTLMSVFPSTLIFIDPDTLSSRSDS